MSQLQSKSSGHKHKMHELLQEILEIQKETQNVDVVMTRTMEIIQESSTLIENSLCPNEIMVDAKILQVGSNLFSSKVSSLTTNLIAFDEDTYVNEVLNRVQNSSEAPAHDEDWKCLAPFTYHLVKKSNPMTFMLGPLSLKPPSGQDDGSQTTQEKRKVERQKKTEQSQKKTLTSETDLAEPEEEGIDIYEHILKHLVRQYKKNDRKPVSYFKFILDPGDYWTTVQNIFHFAFLVRDGSVRMTLVNGVPYVEPVLKKPEDRSGQKTQNHQFCLTVSMEDWEKLIEKFQVELSSIPPFAKEGPKFGRN